MSAVIIDRASIDTFAMHIGGEEFYDSLAGYRDGKVYNKSSRHLKLKYREKCWYNFLTAIVFWDEIVHIMPDDHPWEQVFASPKIFKSIKTIIRPIDGDIHAADEPFFDALENLTRGYVKNPLKKHERDADYRLISSSLGAPILAHPIRAANLLASQRKPLRFNVYDRLAVIDKDLADYFERVNNGTWRKTSKYSYPVFIDDIASKASTPMEKLEAALDLRNRKAFVDFRRELFKFEQLVRNGGTEVEIQLQAKRISDATQGVIKDNKRMKLGEIRFDYVSLVISFIPIIAPFIFPDTSNVAVRMTPTITQIVQHMNSRKERLATSVRMFKNKRPWQ